MPRKAASTSNPSSLGSSNPLEAGPLYLEAVAALPDPILLVTSDGLLIGANQAGHRMLGLTAIDGDLSLSSLVENSEQQLKSWLRVWARSRAPLPGRLIWRTSRISPVSAWCARPATALKPAWIIIQCRSLAVDRFLSLNEQLEITRREATARRQVQAELEAALNARDDFIAVAAHELRNPLNVFHLTLQLMHRVATGPDAILRIRSILEKSKVQLDRLTVLVERLLDVTRIRAGKVELRYETFDLGDLVREAVNRLAEINPDTKVSLHSEPAIGTWDRFRIDQAITNLVSNAIKYGMQKPVHVRVSAANNEAIVVVQDEGIGLSGEDLHRIFNRFERAVPQSNRGGLGLGLWITKRIAEAHSGSISAQGEPGKGSVFTLRLPRQSK
jgi:signal transduction histidine kinase